MVYSQVKKMLVKGKTTKEKKSTKMKELSFTPDDLNYTTFLQAWMYQDYTRLRRDKKGNDISGRYALIGSWLVTKISQVCDKSSESILQRVLSEGWSEGR